MSPGRPISILDRYASPQASRRMTAKVREGDERNGKDHEDCRFHALEHPESAWGLIADPLVPAVSRQTPRSGAFSAERSHATRRRHLVEAYAVPEAVAVGTDKTAREDPRPCRSIAVLSEGQNLGNRCNQMGSDIDSQHDAHGQERTKCRGDGRKDPAEERAHREPERNGEDRIGNRNDSLDVEGIESSTQGIFGRSPPTHQQCQAGGPHDRRHEDPHDVDAQPMPPGDALRPRHALGPLFILLRHEGSGPEQSEQERHNDCGVDEVDDRPVTSEQHAAGL